MFTEEDLVPLSALQHFVFCERQCALIHIEQMWRDNSLTLEGSHRHDRAHETAPRREVRGEVVITRGLPLHSFHLGVSGIADVVEFHRTAAELRGQNGDGASLPGLDGTWQPFPVEYKRGKPKPDRCDEVQLCAQAISLEEMLGVAVPAGALFYGAIQRRHGVRFEPSLRAETVETARKVHHLLRSQVTPPARREPKCTRCSLVDGCRPEVTGGQRSGRRFLHRAITAALAGEVEE